MQERERAIISDRVRWEPLAQEGSVIETELFQYLRDKFQTYFRYGNSRFVLLQDNKAIKIPRLGFNWLRCDLESLLSVLEIDDMPVHLLGNPSDYLQNRLQKPLDANFQESRFRHPLVMPSADISDANLPDQHTKTLLDAQVALAEKLHFLFTEQHLGKPLNIHVQTVGRDLKKSEITTIKQTVLSPYHGNDVYEFAAHDMVVELNWKIGPDNHVYLVDCGSEAARNFVREFGNQIRKALDEIGL